MMSNSNDNVVSSGRPLIPTLWRLPAAGNEECEGQSQEFKKHRQQMQKLQTKKEKKDDNPHAMLLLDRATC